MVASKSTSDSTAYSIDSGRWSGSARTLTLSVGWRSVPPSDLDGGGDADRDERHVDRQLLGHPHQEQVDVERAAVDRVDLDPVDEDRAGLAAVDRQVDQGVRAGVPAQLLELVGVDRHVVGAFAVAVDHGRQPAGVAQAADLLAGDLAMLGGQRRAGSGHGMGPQDVWWWFVGSGLRLAGGAGSAEAPGCAPYLTTRPADGANGDARLSPV